MATINPQMIENIGKKIDAIPDLPELKAYSAQLGEELVKMALEEVKIVANLTPLATVPTDLGSAISWISSFIGAQVVAPKAKAIEGHAELVAATVTLSSKILAKASSLQSDLVALQVEVPPNPLALASSVEGAIPPVDEMLGTPGVEGAESVERVEALIMGKVGISTGITIPALPSLPSLPV